MKLERIEANNVLGARAVNIDLCTPVTLVCAANGNGKTSILEAVRMAMTGQTPRDVNLKKHYNQLVNDRGAKTGQAEVQIHGRDPVFFMVPSGKGAHIDNPALPYVLDAPRFAALDDKERRAFLFSLMGLKITPAEVSKRLAEKGCDKDKVERVLPLLRAGFETAAKEAATFATQAKGAWKSVTNEQWGSQKAEGWKAEVPEFDQAKLDALLSQAADADQSLATANQHVGAMVSQQNQAQQQATQRAELQAKADRIERITAKLATDEQQLAEWQADLDKTRAAAGAGPRVGLVHDLAKALNDTLFFVSENHEFLGFWQGLLDKYEAEHGKLGASGDEKARARLASIINSHSLMTNAVANDRRDLADAQAAKAALAAMDGNAVTVKDSELTAARKAAEDLKVRRAAITTQIDAMSAARRAAADAETNTTKAGAHHADVLAWDAVAQALSPDGVPGEMLAQALEPINQRLLQSATDAEWFVPKINADMCITAGERAYGLLSESEKWRVDAMLAEAISHLSGLKLLILDRFDVLDLKGRADCLAWLDILAQDGEIETALVGATLKGLPSGLADTVTAVWVTDGECTHEVAELSAA